jgi:hypothetical protein
VRLGGALGSSSSSDGTGLTPGALYDYRVRGGDPLSAWSKTYRFRAIGGGGGGIDAGGKVGALLVTDMRVA